MAPFTYMWGTIAFRYLSGRSAIVESIHPLPNFRKRLAVCESAGLGECIAVQLHGELLILADQTGGDYIAREVHVFGIGTSIQKISSTGRIEWSPVLRIVSGKNETSSQNHFDIARSLGERLS